MDSYLTVLTQAAIASRTHEPPPPASMLVEALLQAEKAAKQQRQTYAVMGLMGKWRLCFTTGTRKVQRGGIVLGKGFYLPSFIPAFIEFQALQTSEIQKGVGITQERNSLPDAIFPPTIPLEASPRATLSDPLKIANQIQILGVTLKFIGPARYLHKKNLLAFDFVQMQVKFGLFTLYEGNMPGRNATSELEAFAEIPIAKLPFFAFFEVTENFIAARGRGGGLALWVKEQAL